MRYRNLQLNLGDSTLLIRIERRTEDEVDSCELLEHLNEDTAERPLEHVTTEAIGVGSGAERHFVFEVSLDFHHFVVDEFRVLRLRSHYISTSISLAEQECKMNKTYFERVSDEPFQPDRDERGSEAIQG